MLRPLLPALVATVGLTVAMAATPGASAVDGRAQAVEVPGHILGTDGLRDLDGRLWRSADLAGRIVLIDAWATWCAPCLAELPRLRALASRHPDRLVVLGLNLDTRPRRDLVSWLRRHQVAWPQLYDGRGYGGEAAVRLGLDAIPASWLFGRRGRLVARDLRGETLEAAVAALAGFGTRQ